MNIPTIRAQIEKLNRFEKNDEENSLMKQFVHHYVMIRQLSQIVGEMKDLRAYILKGGTVPHTIIT